MLLSKARARTAAGFFVLTLFTGMAAAQEKGGFGITSSGAVAWTINNATGDVMYCSVRPTPDTVGPEPFCVPANMHPSFANRGKPKKSQ